MKKIALMAFIVCLSNGCAITDRSQNYTYKPPGSYLIQVGIVDAYKYLKYSGKIIKEVLAIKVDENGNTILLVGENTKEEISIYLHDDAKQKLIAGLLEIQELGVKANNEPLKNSKYAGSIVTNQNQVVTSKINLNYDLHESGEYWVCIMTLSGYDIHTMITPHIGTPEGRRDVKLLLTPDAVKSLLSLIGQVHSFTLKTEMNKV